MYRLSRVLGQMEGRGTGTRSPESSQGLRIWAFGPGLYSQGASRQPMGGPGLATPPPSPAPWLAAGGLPGGEGEAGCASAGSLLLSLPHSALPFPILSFFTGKCEQYQLSEDCSQGLAVGWFQIVHLTSLVVLGT